MTYTSVGQRQSRTYTDATRTATASSRWTGGTTPAAPCSAAITITSVTASGTTYSPSPASFTWGV
ncbi:MAG: hypothetical protein R2695_04365 [Acidimicrobiales bacterium]